MTAGALPGIGQVVAGKYRIERLLGRGGMGAVFAAHHSLLQQRVALKVMLAEHASSTEAVTRFLNEARAAARIEGEHVARVLDLGQLEDGSPFIALELLEGSDLAGVLRTRGALPATEVVDYVLQALEALAQAHALGIVHRDLKPANLFLARRRDGTDIVKVLDFGISKVADALTGAGSNPQTHTSSLLGSPGYMAPEQLRSAKTVDARADIWAVGVILYQLLCGRPPFEGETMTEVLVAILEQPVVPPRTWRPDIPPGLESVVMGCLSRDLNARIPNVVVLAEALAPFAPQQAAASVERLRRYMPAVPPSGPVVTLAVPSSPVVAPPGTPFAARPASHASSQGLPTHSQWSRTGGEPPANHRGPIVVAAVIGSLVVLLGVGGAATIVISRRATAVPPTNVAVVPSSTPAASPAPPAVPPSPSDPAVSLAPPPATSVAPPPDTAAPAPAGSAASAPTAAASKAPAARPTPIRRFGAGPAATSPAPTYKPTINDLTNDRH
jgi:serine/threonine-protein kinase